jgi:hypothetical protein
MREIERAAARRHGYTLAAHARFERTSCQFEEQHPLTGFEDGGPADHHSTAAM